MTFKRTPGTAADGSYLYVTIPEDEPVSLSVPTTEQLLQRRRARRLRENHIKFNQERSVGRACYLSGTLILVTLILAGVLHPWHKQDSHQHHRFMRIREFGRNIGGSFGRSHRNVIHDMNSNRKVDDRSAPPPARAGSQQYAASGEDGKVDVPPKDKDLPQDVTHEVEGENDNGHRMLRTMDLNRMMDGSSFGLDGEVGVGDGNSDGTVFLVKDYEEEDSTEKDQ